MRKFFLDKYLSEIVKIIPIWLTPSMITFVRFVFIIPIVFFLMSKMWVWFALFYVFCLVSDVLDGALSRARGMHSKFGAMMDPFVDKLLHWSIFCVYLSFFPSLIGIIIVLDIIVVAGGLIVVLYYQKIGRVLPILGANMYGKMKVVSQSVCIGAFFYRDLFSSSDLNYYISVIFLTVTILLSCMSIYHYIIIISKK